MRLTAILFSSLVLAVSIGGFCSTGLACQDRAPHFALLSYLFAVASLVTLEWIFPKTRAGTVWPLIMYGMGLGTILNAYVYSSGYFSGEEDPTFLEAIPESFWIGGISGVLWILLYRRLIRINQNDKSPTTA